MKNCIQITQIASDSQERPLRMVEKMQLHTHIMMCPGCRAYYKNTQTLSTMMKTLKSQDEPNNYPK